ncbi:nucleotidyltransferase family protein [Butyrivibrio sp. JL13D10]|uniref:nucleotidyltransferase domain-containing protein n=1 Tax=Butyrivibrio sp. JL13D10 TaxID=3236815 RepID=UPI0038B5C189
MGNNNIDYIFQMCRKRLYGDYYSLDRISESNISYKELLDDIFQNNLEAFLYPVLKQVKNDDSYFYENFSALEMAVKKWMFEELKKYQIIRTINSEAEKRGLNFVFFKGIVLADLYPQYAERFSSDSDILVSDDQKTEAETLLKECGYSKYKEGSKEEVQVYANSTYGHTVELHTRLWEDYTGPRIEVLKTMNLSSPETDIKIKACGIDINTLGHEKHLVYQMFHIIKHFSLDGIGIRYLIDITLFVNKYFDEIDFTLFWKHMDMLGYTKFVEAFFRICIVELKMTDKVFDNHQVKWDSSVENLKLDLLKIGNIHDKEAGWQIMGAMEAYFTGEAKASDSSFKNKLRMAFPSVKALPKVYGYAKKCPILLPVAWIHRDVKFLIKKAIHKDDFYGINEKMSVADRRLRLIKELELTD